MIKIEDENMLSKLTNTIFAVITVLLIVIMITLLAKLNKAENVNDQLAKELGDHKILVAEQREKLSQKLVEVVHVNSTNYEENKTNEKPKIEYVNKTIERLVSVPVYSNVCLDDAGLSVINSTINRTYLTGDTTTGS